MKKLAFYSYVTAAICSLAGPITTYAQPNAISVKVDDLPVAFDVQPVIQDGRTLVPFRKITESLNAEVTWDEKSQTIHSIGTSTSIVLQIGKNTALVNGEVTPLDVPPVILNGRTLIPLRFYSESLKAKVTWDEANQEVSIISPVKDMEVIGFYGLGSKTPNGDTRSWPDLFAREYPEISTGNTDIVSELALAWYQLDEQGNLMTNNTNGWKKPEDWERVIEAAKEYRMLDEMVVHIPDGSPVAKNLLADANARENAVNNLIHEAKGLYNGINLDIEGLGLGETETQLEDTRSKFSTFIRELSAKAKANHLRITLTLHAPNSSYKGYDYQTLGEIADRMVIMAYDYSSVRGPEPIDQVSRAVEMAKEAVPAEKLFLGISAYNETRETLLSKIGIAKKYNLQGIALWRIGLLTDPMWDVLKANIHAIK